MSQTEMRIYSVRTGRGNDSKIVAWGASRFGETHDPEMEEAVCAASGKVPGDGKSFCVGFTPGTPRLKSAEQVRAQRIRNMKRRAAREPLFADQIEAREMKREYFSIETAERHQAERRAFWDRFAKRFWEEHASELEVKI